MSVTEEHVSTNEQGTAEVFPPGVAVHSDSYPTFYAGRVIGRMVTGSGPSDEYFEVAARRLGGDQTVYVTARRREDLRLGWHDHVRDSFHEGVSHEETIEAAHKRTAELNTLIDTTAQRARRAEGELDAFRDRVRDMAIEKAAELGWCTPGLNEALEALGLARKSTMFEVSVELVASRTITVHVESESAEQAWKDVDAMDQDALREARENAGGTWPLDSSDWDYSSHDSSTHVTEA